MKEREVLKLAMDFIERTANFVPISFDNEGMGICATIKEALSSPNGEAQPEQEPVAWITEKISGPTKGYMTVTFNKDTGWKNARSIPLYESPPQRKPLTDEEIRKAKHHMVDGAYQYSFMQGVRYAEAAHGIGVDK